MAKVDLVDITNLQNESTAVSRINLNSSRIEAAMEKTLSRDGTSPNEMNANLDMNNNRIYNLPEPLSETEPLRRAELDSLLENTIGLVRASQGEAEAGTDNFKVMTPLRTKQQIDAWILQRTYDSRAVATAATVPTSVTNLTTMGYTIKNDGGSWGKATWVEIIEDGSPLEAWEMNTNGGTRRWVIADQFITPQMFGVVGTANDSVAHQAMVNASAALKVQAVVPVGSTITLTTPTVCNSFARVFHAPGSQIFTNGNGSMLAYSAEGASSGSAKTLTGNAGVHTNNTQSVPIASGDETIVAAGDYVLVYDDREISPGFGRNREIARVKSISAGVINFYTSLRRNYATSENAAVIKFVPKEGIELTGSGLIKVREDNYTTTITTTNGNTAATVASFDNLVDGMQVQATGVSSAATITLGSFPNITLSVAATATGSNTAVFFNGRGGGIMLEDSVGCLIDGVQVRNPMGFPAIAIYRCQDTVVRNTDIRDGQVPARGGYAYAINIDDSSINIQVENNYSENCRENVLGSRCLDCNIINNRCNSMVFNGWNNHATGCRNILFEGNVVVGTRLGPGMSSGYTTGRTGDESVIFDGNAIIDSQLSGLQITGGTNSEAVDYFAAGIVVTNNLIDGFGFNTLSSEPPDGIFLYMLRGAVISNNIIKNGNRHPSSTGIRGVGSTTKVSTDVVIEGNQFEAIGTTSTGAIGAGINLDWFSRALIHGNSFKDISGGSGGSAYNLNISANCVADIKDNTSNTTSVNIASTNYQWGNSWQPKNGEWVAFTPSFASSSGTITTISDRLGRYCIIGKECHVIASATITNNGTGSGLLGLTLPITAASGEVYPAYGMNVTTSLGLTGRNSGTGTFFFAKAVDGTYPVATGNSITVAAIYPIP